MTRVENSSRTFGGAKRATTEPRVVACPLRNGTGHWVSWREIDAPSLSVVVPQQGPNQIGLSGLSSSASVLECGDLLLCGDPTV